MSCPRLWRSVLWSRRCPYFAGGVLERLCLTMASEYGAVYLAVAFRIYHDLKINRLDTVLGLRDGGRIKELATLVKHIASGARRFFS